ncbi:hypothetical protein D3C72_2221090 [compost metagenome]
MGTEAIGDHLGRNFAGVRTGLLLVAILGADHQGAVVAERGRHIEQRRGRADQRLDLARQIALDPFGHRLDLIERGARSVHLPVSGDERADVRRHEISSGSGTFLRKAA